MKASCIRNLSHQDRRWMENSIATFWGDWGKTSGANVQASGVTTRGPCIITKLVLTPHSLCGSFWLLRARQSSSTLPTHRTLTPVIFSYSRIWNWSSRGDFWQHWRDPDRIAGHDNADTKWLPALLPIMKISLRLLYQCRKGLLRREWRQKKIPVSV